MRIRSIITQIIFSFFLTIEHRFLMRIMSIITQIILAKILFMNMQGLMRMKEFREPIPKREMNSTA